MPCPSKTPALILALRTGSASQKGRVMGILRSLGALARALGPILSATGECGILLPPASATHSSTLAPTAWEG